MPNYKTVLSFACQLVLWLAWHHYQPVGADLLGILLVVMVLCFALRVYFATLDEKRKNIAKYKARHGIPPDQPHKIDAILQEGFFRAD